MTLCSIFGVFGCLLWHSAVSPFSKKLFSISNCVWGTKAALVLSLVLGYFVCFLFVGLTWVEILKRLCGFWLSFIWVFSVTPPPHPSHGRCSRMNQFPRCSHVSRKNKELRTFLWFLLFFGGFPGCGDVPHMLTAFLAGCYGGVPLFIKLFAGYWSTSSSPRSYCAGSPKI